MKQINQSSRLVEALVKAGLVAAIVAALLVPTTIRVHGSESAARVDHAWPMLKRTSWDALPLPPIPYLETMPWLVREPQPKGFKIDRLLAPKFEMMRQDIASGGDTGLPHGKPLDGFGNG